MKTHDRLTLIRGGRLLLLSLLLFSSSARAAGGRQASPRLDWREFTSEAGGFTVKFPGSPRVSNPKMSTGPFTLTRHVHEVSVGDYSFEMDYIDMPAGGNADNGREAVIMDFVERARDKGGRVLSDGKVSRGTCEGREASVLIPSRAGASRFEQMRLIYSGRRLYLTVFTAGEDRPAAREAARLFMDSFVIRDGCGAAAPAAAPKAEPVRSTVEGAPDAATGWRRIESAEHGFSVLMPGAARRTSRQSQVGPVPLFFHDYAHESDAVTYEAKLQGDYEGLYEDYAALEGQLDLSIYVLRKNLEPRGLSFTEASRFKAGPHPAREYVVTGEGAETRGRVRLYATPRRAYLFIALTRGKGAPPAADLERFFSSIKVSPK